MIAWEMGFIKQQDKIFDDLKVFTSFKHQNFKKYEH